VYTIFDLIKDNPENYNVDYELLRTGRTAVGLLGGGTYLIVLGLKTLIPDTTKKGKV